MRPPTGESAPFLRSDRYPPIAEVAEPTLRLAGLRINPKTQRPRPPAPWVTGIKGVNVGEWGETGCAVRFRRCERTTEAALVP